MSEKDDYGRIDSDESEGNAGFLRAARDGNLVEVLEYLKGSTDINTSNPNGLNALHLASKEGHFKIVSELIHRGANVEAATKKGNTALHIASLAGHEDIVTQLVDNKAQINLQAQAGFTPLYMAAQEGKVEVVKYLLASGANQGLSTEDGFTPLAVALQQGHEKVVSVLLEHDAKGKVRLPALHIAAKKDDVKSAALLLQNEQNSVDVQTKGGLVNDTTKSGFTPLHIAAHYGNVNVANLLIQREAQVNFKAKNNITPLHVASRWGKLNMVNLLLDNYSRIDEKTRDGLMPLHCAARSGHDTVVDVILERGAPHSAKTKNGLTPLHMAAQGDHEDCARLLLYHKASLNEVTVDYLTPLHVAAHCGNVKTAKLLLDRKCEPNARALNGFTPLHISCKKNRIKVVELLLKYGASIESKTESGLTPLHVSSFMGHMNIVIYLIQHNANPNTPTVRGETSLHLAARANQSDIIRILLRNGATVDAKAREQQTPLHIASRLGNVDNVVLLLQHGAAVDATTKDKYTPLHIAAKEGHEEVAQVLLEHEAQHNITTKKGFTPLHISAKYGNIKVARMLLQKDANPDVQGKNGLTPLHVATHYNHSNVAQLLLENNASPHASAKNGYTPLHIAAKKNQMDIATMLLEYGAKPNAESKNGFTPLHLAAQEGHTDIVSLLLQKDANVNAIAHNGLTPMHLAAQEDKVPVAEILVKYGSETEGPTKAGYTPLHTACHFGQINMVRFLLDHKASVNATTKVGYTPLHQAAQQGHVQVVSLLLKNQASPNAVTNNGQSPLAIAQKLGYISVVEILKPVTEVQVIAPATEDKYKVVSPETMQEAFISDSEDEGDDFMPQSPIFGKPLSEQHVYLPYYEGQKIQNREDSISLERGGSASPLDMSFDKDSQMRHHVQDHRGRVLSQMGATLYYPSYLENGPDYEEEMRYYQGDTLSPKDKNETGDKSRIDSVFGDYSTLGRDSILESSRDRSTANSTGDMFDDEDLKYVADDAFMKKDYMDAQITSQTFSTMYSAPPPNYSRLPVGTESNRFSSYSGSSFSTSFDPDNVPVDRSPVYAGKLNWKSFLISFMVDARGGAMRGCRHPGVRFIVPPRKCSMPTRVTCRMVKKEKLTRPPPMLEGEGLAARVLEMGPVGTKFLGPVLIEVPHYASLRGKEREVVILRSDNGESWYEHPMQATEDAVTDALGTSAGELDPEEDLAKKRIKRILTADLPMYFALVSRVTRVKQESTVIGMEGGVLSSNVVPQVQAVLPEGTLTRPIPVALQAQPIAPELVAKLLGNRVAVSPIVTIEPRRRKFHKPITLFIPVPRAAQKGMINQYSAERPTLRLLFSLAADPNPAVWEDVTDSKPMSLVDDCVSFTTTVSARFWLIDCQNISEASQMASVLYQEAVTVPYMAKFVVFAKRDSPEEGKLRIFCMTDDKDDKTLEKQEKFFEVARSRDIEVLEGRPQFVEMAGNLIPVTKSGDQLHVNFKAFRENRLPCTVKIRDQDQDPSARVAFMKEPKVARGEAPQVPICNLNIKLPDMVSSDSGELDGDRAAELRRGREFLVSQGLVLQDSVNRSQMKLSDIADAVQGDWVMLAQQLEVPMSDINQIKNNNKTVGDQAMAMLHLWVDKNGDKATGNELEAALRRINREDVVRKCMHNVERVDDEVEAAAARVAMDQSGFDDFKEEVGITKDSMRRGMSLDVQYDEQDMLKNLDEIQESESAGESPTGEKAPVRATQAQVASPMHSAPATEDDDMMQALIDYRRPAATIEVKTPEEEGAEAERKRGAYLKLAEMLDDYADKHEASRQQEKETDDDNQNESVAEDNIVRSAKTSPVESYPALRAGFKTQPKVTFSDHTEQLPDDEEVNTPPPSPSDKFHSEEPVHTTQSDILEAANRLASETAEDFDTDGQRLLDTRTDDYTEVMYSRAEVPAYSAPSQITSEPSSEIVSPTSDGFQDRPSSVPEPALPEDFKDDELAFEKPYDEFHVDYKPESDSVTGFKEADSMETLEDQPGGKLFDIVSEVDTSYRTADESLDESGANLDEPSYETRADRDGVRQRYPVEEDLYEKEPEDSFKSKIQGYPVDKDLYENEPEDSFRPDAQGYHLEEEFNDNNIDIHGESESSFRPEVDSFVDRPEFTSGNEGQGYPVEDDIYEKEPEDSFRPEAQGYPVDNYLYEKEPEDSFRPETQGYPLKDEFNDNNIDAHDGSKSSFRPEVDSFVDRPDFTSGNEGDGYPVENLYEKEPVDSFRPEGQGYSVEEFNEDDVYETEPKSSFRPDVDFDVDRQYITSEESSVNVMMIPEVVVSEEAPSDVDMVAYPDVSGSEQDIVNAGQFELTAQLGDEDFVDHKEETIAVEPVTLSRGAGKMPSFGVVSFTAPQDTSPFGADVYATGGDQHEDPSVFDEEGSVVEILPDGTRRRSCHHTASGMELVHEEGPAQRKTEVQDEEEILPDGTVHHVHRVRHHSLKSTKKSWKSIDGEEIVVDEQSMEVPGSVREDVVETFAEPPKMVHEERDVEEILEDGSKIQKHIVMNRMVSHIRTHQESFDEGQVKQVEDYETDQIIPGTESAFVMGVDSSSSSSYTSGDEEEEEFLKADMDETKELKDDGSSIINRHLTAQQHKTVRSRSGSLDECDTQITVTETEIAPSPRPRSPVDDIYDITDRETVQTIKTTTHLEETRQDDTVERTLDIVQDMLSKGALAAPDSVSVKAVEAEAPEQGDERIDSGVQGEDDDIQTHRLMMKKEVHKKTVLGADGHEETTIREDSQVQQDDDPPEELRESMQEIINQFMESNPEPAKLPESSEQHLEDEV